MEGEALVPKLRFPEFKDEPPWKRHPLASVLTYERPENYIVASTNYSPDGIPVLTANKSFILGYTEETEGIFTEVPAIIFDDFTTDRKYVDFPFKVKSSAIKILRPLGDFQLKVIYELMGRIKFDPKEHKRYYISEYQHLEIPIPNANEQLKISDCLTSLDELIAAEARKLEALRTFKKGLLQNLFPRPERTENGVKIPAETTPRLRFPEYQSADHWVETNLRDLTDIQDGFAFKSKDFVAGGEFVIQVIRITDINNHNSNDDKVFVPRDLIASQKLGKYIVNDGDLLLSLTGAAGFKFFFWDGGQAVNNQRTAKISMRKSYNRATLRLLEPLISDRINKKGEGQNNNLSREFLNTITLKLPEEGERQRIADCLSSLDNLITTQTKELDSLRIHKQALMQNLFPSMETSE